MRALLSVTDKTGLVEFARGLVAHGFELISTGGTARALREGGLTVLDVSEVTGFPEMLDGRVKTLHPLVHGALLGDRRLEDPRHQRAEAGMQAISLVCVNLYAFEKTVTGPHTFEEAVESIDIGGPAMIRAASKNHANVAVVVDPSDYPSVLASLAEGRLPDMHRSLAAKAFRHTAYYDSMIARWLTAESGEDAFRETLTVGYKRVQSFRYGENPHQAGALYADPLAQPGIAQCVQLWGKDLSYCNLNDANKAWELVTDLPPNACAIIKHANPCGAACGSDFGDAYRLARSSDTVSAFGGVAAFNGVVDRSAAEAMTEKGNYLEIVIGTAFSDDALAIFKERSGWGQDVRLLTAPLPPAAKSLMIKTIRDGAIVQESDEDPGKSWQIVTKAQPTAEQMEALRFQWKVIPHVKSNAIVVGSATQLLGVGAGQMNRVQSVRLALEQAGEGARGAALASDAFFPFPDSIHTAASAGIAAIAQPGGSKKDPDVIAAADELGIAMVFTGVRHFQH